jgi:prepilin-type N-terminal cleavage/methylation domain-containing protein
MNKKAFTLLEVIIALILASVLTIGSIKVIENMQHETERFKQQVDDDMTWLTANHHLAKNVRGSSYLEVSNGGNTLTLRGYNDDVRGIYNNDPVSHRITYSVGPNVTNTFQNVNATFSPVSAGPTGKGWRNERNIEVIINYSLPFANVLYLRCVADVKPTTSPGWAVIIGGMQNDSMGQIKRTSDGGYILVGSTASFGNGGSDIYVLKFTREGVREWSRAIGTNKGDVGLSVCEIFNAIGLSDGYLIGGWVGDPVFGTQGCMIRLNSNGNFVSALRLKSASHPVYRFYSVAQSFNALTGGQPTGFIGAGTGGGEPPDIGTYTWRTDTALNPQWLRKISTNPTSLGITNEEWYSVMQTFNASGNPDGFLMAGSDNRYNGVNNTSTPSLIYMSKVDLSGNYLWSNEYTNGSSNYSKSDSARFVQHTFNASNLPDGYIVAGQLQMYAQSRPFITRLDLNGTRQWFTIIPDHGGYSGDYYRRCWHSGGGTFCIGATTTEGYAIPPSGFAMLSRMYVTQISAIGSASAPLFFTREPGVYIYRGTGTAPSMRALTAGGEPDGYILAGSCSVGATTFPGLNMACVYLAKADNQGACPADRNPTYIVDTPTVITIASGVSTDNSVLIHRTPTVTARPTY